MVAACFSKLAATAHASGVAHLSRGPHHVHAGTRVVALPQPVGHAWRRRPHSCAAGCVDALAPRRRARAAPQQPLQPPPRRVLAMHMIRG